MSSILPGRFAAFLVGLCWPFVVAAEPDSWTSQTGMPTARVFHGACSANDRLYVFGGQTMGGGAGIASVEEYDPATDSWRARADMPAPSLGMSVSEVGGKCYLAGGASAPGGVALDTVYEYDPATNGWRGVADMPTARVAAAISPAVRSSNPRSASVG